MRRAKGGRSTSDGPWASPITETLYPAEEFWPVVVEPSMAVGVPTLKQDRGESSFSASGGPMVGGPARGLYAGHGYAGRANALLWEAPMASQRVGATAFRC